MTSRSVVGLLYGERLWKLCQIPSAVCSAERVHLSFTYLTEVNNERNNKGNRRSPVGNVESHRKVYSDIHNLYKARKQASKTSYPQVVGLFEEEIMTQSRLTQRDPPFFNEIFMFRLFINLQQLLCSHCCIVS